MVCSEERIAIIGLGYVGLPLSVALSKHYKVCGFDVSHKRIAELQSGYDATHEVNPHDLKNGQMALTTCSDDIKGHDIYIITVPTPVTKDYLPDLSSLKAASIMVGRSLKKGSIVVYESTVYPGVTEDFCLPLLEQESHLVCGKDFYLGYSPERVNPGDRHHTLQNITKVVSAQTDDIAHKLAAIYGSINHHNIFIAKNIKTAEAAKVIENAQRDINVAFMNEVTKIFRRIGVSMADVLDAAKTKWNFLPFSPGLVGGHCIGVDPYYLSYLAHQVGYEPEVILSGRRTNESMSGFIADDIHHRLVQAYGPGASLKILVLGLTFKENVPDLRNTKVIDVITKLQSYGYQVSVHDPLANPKDVENYYGLVLHTDLHTQQDFHGLVGAVPHAFYQTLAREAFHNLLCQKGIIFDIKGIWRADMATQSHAYISL